MTTDPHGAAAVLHAGAPLGEASLAVILLHGRGASAEDILGLSSAINLPGIAYLAPQAAGHTWYPQSFLAPRAANEPSLSSALAKVGAVVRTAAEAGLGLDRIVVAGFSQGACLATEFVARNPARYGGLIAFTGGLIGPPGTDFSPLRETAPEALAGMPALFCSGDPDPHVPWARVEESAAVLAGMGASVIARRIPGRPHTVTQAELQLAHDLLTNALQQPL
jgi:phospholipase/carboxylesterase